MDNTDNNQIKSEDKIAHPDNPESIRREVGIRMSWIVFSALALIFIMVMGLVVFFAFRGVQQLETLEEQTTPPVPDVYSATSDFPFKELTIPYLRERKYEREMSDLAFQNDNGRYASYLTSYKSDGLNINALLTKPLGDMPQGGWPAIVFVHGYIPPSTYQTSGQSYSDYVDYLARNGFIVFKIDLRGHGSSEGEASGAYYSGDYVIDVLNARAALRNLDFVNPEKVGLWGHSMAGNVTFRSFVASDDIPALVIWAGAVYTYDDWQEFGLNDNSYRPPMDDSERQRKRDELFGLYGEFDANSEFWKMVVPVNYLDMVKGAVQLNHSVNDEVVNIEYSRNLSKILDDVKIKNELNEYLVGGHNISGSVFNQAMQNTVRFFNDNLK